MKANDQNALNVPGGRGKVTMTGATDRARLDRLNNYLRGLLHHHFTEKGKANICQRFGVDADELATAVAALQAPRPSRPTPELLQIIGAALPQLVPRRNGKGGSPC